MAARLSLCLVLAVLAAPCSALETPAPVTRAAYSAAPLKDPLFDEASVVVEATALNNWLNGNIQKLSYEQMKGPREHLYYLIDSHVKHLYAQNGQLLPKAHDPILQVLFAWSERLGVYGGALVHNSLKSADVPAQPSLLRIPQGMTLTLDRDLLVARSDKGWSLQVPYHFMIWTMGDFKPKGGGPQTQLVGLSTGAMRDKTQAGRSQSTMLFLFSAEQDFAAFEGYWLDSMGIPRTTKAEPLGVGALKGRHAVEASQYLHKEFTAWPDAAGSYAVVFMGTEGSYEWNRPHFLDFLRSIRPLPPQQNK